MTLDEKRWQQVNAYVDGELDPAAAADIAAAVARDRMLANAVAAVTQLKAVTSGSIAAPAAISLGEARRPLRWTALAASIVFGLGVAAAVALYRSDEPGSLAGAVERHKRWVTAESLEAPTLAVGATLAGLAKLGHAAEIPDLSDAGLVLSQVSLIDGRDGANGFQLRYIGSRGCRVSLMIERVVGSVPARQDVGSVRTASWQVGDLRYTLLASGMHSQRFGTISATAEAATRRDRPTVETLRQALRDEREQTPPCPG